MANKNDWTVQDAHDSFRDTFRKLCAKAGKSESDVIFEVTKKPPQKELYRINMVPDYVPDIWTMADIADYFGVGVDDFLPTASRPARNVKNIYLAGPITGVPDFMDRFADGEAYLAKIENAHVFSPARATAALPKAHMTRQDFMELGLCILRMCGTIALLPGWEESKGCLMEKAYAETNRYQVCYLDEGMLYEGRRIRKTGTASS